MKRRLRLCTSDQKPKRGLILFPNVAKILSNMNQVISISGFGSVNEFLDMSRSIHEITKSASRTLGAVYTKYLHAGGMSYDVYTKLISSLVEPVLFYGAGIWGTRYHKEIDVVLNKACRYFLGTNKNASNIATIGDMGWDSCIVKQKLETVRLWCRLKHQAKNRLSSKVHHWSLHIGNSWEKRIMSFIAELNLADVMLID